MNKLKIDKPAGPRIMLSYQRDDKTGSINRIRTVPFQEGMIIERSGKRYQVDAKGTQRRIK